jgi:glycosyltransferase involved in cell wall biosynthesis
MRTAIDGTLDLRRPAGSTSALSRGAPPQMRILLISNMFPPFIMGGAEMAASSLARLLAKAGHEVHVLTSAPTREAEGCESVAERLTVERRFFPNIFQIYQADRNRSLSKIIWHVNDHFHAQSEQICRQVIDQFQPDVVNTHDLQGIGYNLLKAIGERRVPCVQTLHDFGFMCVSMNMFRHGRECRRYHLTCQASAAVKRSYFEQIEALAFISPSAALLERYRPHLPRHREATVIPLPLEFESPPAAARSAAAELDPGMQLLYVGQVERWKGIDFLLEVLAGLAPRHRFHLRVLGGGSLLERLQESYGRAAWVTFEGKVPAGRVGAYMQASDLLVVPSMWFENAPLVISQALRLSLPVLASDTGGLPEMVKAGGNGELLAPGNAAAWSGRLAALFREPAIVQRWRAQAGTTDETTAPEALTAKVLEVFARTAARPPVLTVSEPH